MQSKRMICHFACLLVLCFALAGPTNANAKAKAPHGISVTLERQKGKALTFSIVLTNVSKRAVRLSTIPALHLQQAKGGDYWSPLNLHGKPLHLKANHRVPLQLKAGQTLRLVCRLSALLWDHSISSEWPGHPLRWVKPGWYQLYLDIEVMGKKPKRIRSNKLKVRLVSQGK